MASTSSAAPTAGASRIGSPSKTKGGEASASPSLLLAALSEGCLHCSRSLAQRGREHVAVGVGSELDAAVAEDLADHQQRDVDVDVDVDTTTRQRSGQWG